MINDEAYFPGVIGSRRFVGVYFNELLKQLCISVPVIVIEFTAKKCFEKQSWAALLHEGISEKYGQKTISLRRILKDYLDVSDIDSSSIYRDNIHFSDKVSYSFGLSIGRSLESLVPSKYKEPIKKNFEIITENFTSLGKATKFKNKLFDVQATKLNGSEIKLHELEENEFLVGYKIISTHTNCFLKLESIGETKYLSLNYSTLPLDTHNKFMIKYVPVRPFIGLKRISVIRNLAGFKNGNIMKSLHSEQMTKGVFTAISYTKLTLLNNFTSEKFDLNINSEFSLTEDEELIGKHIKTNLRL